MKLLINKQVNPETNEVILISTQLLNESDYITYEIVEVEAIEAQEGFTGNYVYDNESNAVKIEYTKNPITTEERITAMQEVIDSLLMGGM